MKHKLKTHQEYLDAIRKGDKTFEIRRDDRGFSNGDILWLKGWDSVKEEFTGDELKVDVSYILRDAPQFGLQEGFCLMGIKVRVKPTSAERYQSDLDCLAKYPNLQIDEIKWSHLDYLPHRSMTFVWSGDLGFGELSIGLDADGKAYCDTEAMGGDFVRAIITLFYLEANPHWDPRNPNCLR